MIDLTPIVEQCADDGADRDLGRTWVLTSPGFTHPLAGYTEHRGIVGEDVDGGFRWEAWAIYRPELCETYALGHAETFEGALAAARMVWACWGMGYVDTVPGRVEPRRSTFSKRMAGN